MARDAEIIRTADICDDHRDDARVCELAFNNYAGRDHFHGEVVTFATFEDNKELRNILEQDGHGGAGKVLVVDGRGSHRRALCGGSIAAKACGHGWAGLVFKGCIRDSHEFSGLDFGVKAIGATAMPPHNEGIGYQDVELSFGGIIILPGDYLYADRDAVVVLDRPDHE